MHPSHDTKPDQSENVIEAPGQRATCVTSSSGSTTTPSSGDTVPTTQEVCPAQEQFDESHESQSWGAFYPIDSRFYPIEFHNDVYTFGRGEDCSYSFDIPSIRKTPSYKQYSKQHFTIKRTFNSSHTHIVLLIDTSMNGVYVNGERVPSKSSRQLCSKDEIAIAMEKNRVFFYFDKTEEVDSNLPKRFNDKYIMHKLLGSGAYGEVRMAMAKFGTEQHAVKIIKKQRTIFESKDPDSACEEILKEAQLLLSLQHPFIITVQDVFDSPQNLYIVLELAPGGDLYSRVVKKGWLGDGLSKLVFFQMASAVAYLHKRNVSHRDLKPENILMMSEDDECPIKITDFGVSRLVEESSFMKTQAGTPSYLAPELIKLMTGMSKGYTKQVDSWSMGVILFVCLVGYPPFLRGREDTNQELLQQILHGNYNFNHVRWSNITEDGNETLTKQIASDFKLYFVTTAKDLVSKMLEVDPDKRFTPDQCTCHVWLDDEDMKAKVKQLAKNSANNAAPCDSSVISVMPAQRPEHAGVEMNFASQCGDDVSNSSTSSAISSADQRNLKRSDERIAVCDIENKRFAGASNVNPDVPLIKKQPDT